MKSEWRDGVEFAEFAEALGCETDRVMAVLDGPEFLLVLYTPDADYTTSVDTRVVGAVLKRDADEILRLVGTPEPRGTFRDYMPPR